LGGSIGRVLAATAIAVLAALGAGPPPATHSSPPAVYADAIGDAGDAPDIAQITISPVRGGLAVDVRLARPMQLGAYGWVLFGVDTDRNPYSGGGRGDELLVLANGEGTTFARWTGSGFTSRFYHHDLGAALSVTDLTFVLSVADTDTLSFEFSVASLREDADLAPGRGVATYPRPSRRSRRAPPPSASRRGRTTFASGYQSPGPLSLSSARLRACSVGALCAGSPTAGPNNRFSR